MSRRARLSIHVYAVIGGMMGQCLLTTPRVRHSVDGGPSAQDKYAARVVFTHSFVRIQVHPLGVCTTSNRLVVTHIQVWSVQHHGTGGIVQSASQ